MLVAEEHPTKCWTAEALPMMILLNESPEYYLGSILWHSQDTD